MSFKRILFVLCFFMLLFSVYANKYEGKKISSISVKGNKFTDEFLIIGLMKSKVNFPYKQFNISSDLKEIYKLGRFKDVVIKAEIDGNKKVKLLIEVQELPVVNAINFVNLREFTFSELRDDFPIKKGDFLSDRKIVEAKIYLYNKFEEKGYLEASFDIKTEKYNAENNKIDVKVIINEGAEIKVGGIKFTGNKVFSEKRLRWQMETKVFNWVNDGSYKEEQFQKDIEKLTGFYKNHGYVNVKITADPPVYRIASLTNKKTGEIKKNRKKVYLSLHIEEGEQYYFGGYSISGNTLFTTAEIMKRLRSEKKKVFNQSFFDMDIAQIYALYSERGYVFAHVNIESKEKREKIKDNEVNVIYYNLSIYEGTISMVKEIIIKGNKKTKENVIRREVLVKPGEIFNGRKIQQSKDRIQALGFFKTVNIDAKPALKEGEMNLIISVEEQQTGTVSMGGGYGTKSGAMIYAEVSENNFLGNGQKISGRIEYGMNRKNFNTSFTTPWFMNLPISIGGSFFLKWNNYGSQIFTLTPTTSDEEENNSYTHQAIGTAANFGQRLNPFLNLSESYSFEFYRYTDIKVIDSTHFLYPYSNSEADYKYKGIKSSFISSLTFDNRNDLRSPTKGGMVSFSVETSGGIFGGTDNYVKYQLRTAYYQKLFTIKYNWVFVLAFNINAGLITPPWGGENPWGPGLDKSIFKLNVPEQDRFILNWVRIVRLWSTVDLDSINRGSTSLGEYSWYRGGNAIISGNIELRIPALPGYLEGLIFFDFGSMWAKGIITKNDPIFNNDIFSSDNVDRDYFKGMLQTFWDMRRYKFSLGLGIRIQIPMMPLRFYVGVPFQYFEDKMQPVSRTGNSGTASSGTFWDWVHFDFDIGGVF